MKTIIAGCRTLANEQVLLDALEDCPWFDQITEVVCGMAKGADMIGFEWATRSAIPVKTFPADWERYSKKAGPTRNRQMGDYADRKCGERNGTDSEKQDGAEIAFELFPNREVGAVHEERWQEYDNHQVRVQVNGRKTWHESHGNAANQ